MKRDWLDIDWEFSPEIAHKNTQWRDVECHKFAQAKSGTG